VKCRRNYPFDYQKSAPEAESDENERDKIVACPCLYGAYVRRYAYDIAAMPNENLVNPVRKGASGLRSSTIVSAFHLTHRVRGPGYIVREFASWSHRLGAVYVLRALGAQIGERSHFEPGLRIQNATNGDCTRLNVGEDVWVGPEALIDLKGRVTLEDRVTMAGASRLSPITMLDLVR